jgi:undecaprenyl diphosphate synthase
VARLEKAVAKTAANTRLTMVVALNYGSQSEIAAAARALGKRVAEGQLGWDHIDEQAVEQGAQTATFRRSTC